MQVSRTLRYIVFGTVPNTSCSMFLLAGAPQRFVSAGGHHGVTMISVQQKECPFTIQETTHALADALTGAVLRKSSSKNSSSKTIVAYRDGMDVCILRRQPQSRIGRSMDIREGIAPDAMTIVPAQGVWVLEISQDTRAIVFFRRRCRVHRRFTLCRGHRSARSARS